MSSLTFASLKDYMHKTLSSTTKHEPVNVVPPSIAAASAASASAASAAAPTESMEQVARKLLGETIWSYLATTSTVSAPSPIAPASASACFFREHHLDGVFLLPRLAVVGPPRAQLSPTDQYRNDCFKLKQALIRHRLGLHRTSSSSSAFNSHVLLFDLAPQHSRVDLDALQHNCVRFDLGRPTLEVLYEATEAVTAWLALHEDNIALLTCTNGILVSSLLAACVYAQLENCHARDGALAFFQHRFHQQELETYDDVVAKLPPSYGRLWRTFDGEGAACFGSELVLRRLTVRQLPFAEDQGDEQIRVVVRQGAGFSRVLRSFCTPRFNNPVRFCVESSTWQVMQDEEDEEIRLVGDVTLDFSIGNSLVFNFSFPTSTLRNAMKHKRCTLTYGPDIMDEYKKHALPGDFELEIEVESVEAASTSSAAMMGGLELCSTRHCITANPFLVKELVKGAGGDVTELQAAFALQRHNNDLHAAKQELRPAPKSAIKEKKTRLPLQPITPGNSNNNVPLSTPSRKQTTPQKQTTSHKKRQQSLASLSAAVAATPSMVPASASSKGGMTTPAKQRKAVAAATTPGQQHKTSDEEDELNLFLKQMIGTTLGSPVTPRTGTASSTSTDNTEQLVQQFTERLQRDPTFKDRIERLVLSKAESAVAAVAVAPVVEPVPAPPVPPTTAPTPALPLLGDHETYGTFFKMLKCGVPRVAVEQKMQRDGHDVRALDLGPHALVSQLEALTAVSSSTGEEEEAVSLLEHDTYGRFFRMLKCGIPAQAVKNKMQSEGVCSAVLDLGETTTRAKLDAALAVVAVAAEKPALTTTRKKSIRWDAIPADRLTAASLWTTSAGEEGDEQEAALMRALHQSSSDFERLFVTAAPTSAPVASLVDAPAVTAAATSVLDSRRAQSVSIGMAKLKLTGEQLAGALLTKDLSVLTADAVQVIQGCSLFPTADELKLLLTQSKKPLAAPDAFLLAVGGSASVGEVIEALAFKYHFDELCVAARGDLEAILQASRATRTSTRLRDLLRAILLLGNHINGEQQSDKQQRGITLASLAKLGQTKSAVNRTVNVLEYMVGVLAKQESASLQAAQELDAVLQPAKRLDVQLAVKQCGDVAGTLQRVRMHLGDDGFCVQADVRVLELLALSGETQREYSACVAHLGEDPGMPCGELFGTLHSFLSSLQRAHADWDDKERRAKRKLESSKPAAVVKKPASAAASPDKKIAVASLKRTTVAAAARQQEEGATFPHLANFLKHL